MHTPVFRRIRPVQMGMSPLVLLGALLLFCAPMGCIVTDCILGPPDSPCRTYQGVIDLPSNTLTVHLTGDDTNFVNVVYQREFAGG